MAALRTKLASRSLVAGDRLPSIRSLAATLGVSASTVVTAYDRLAAEGMVRAHRGSGFTVSGVGSPPPSPAIEGLRPDRVVDPFWISRQALDADPAALKPGCGWLPSDWMPLPALRQAVRALARADDPVLTDYGTPRGSPTLRRQLLRRLAEEGLDIPPEQILLTASGSQAIDLICRLMLKPGDTVLVDDPCYFNFHAMLRTHRVRIIGIAHTRSGPNLVAFETALTAERPVLYITNSALQNPTGASLSPQIAHRLLRAASRHGLVIIEDDIFADFEQEPSPRLAALDGLDRVIRIGSFSKTLSASIRCGYIVARSDWIEGLIDLQLASGFGGPSPVAAEIVAAVLAGGGYRKHMEALRRRLAGTMRTTSCRLEALGVQPWLLPRGGFSLWCEISTGQDAEDLARRALLENVVLAPGNVFSASGTASTFLRFNVAQSGDPRLYEVLQRAMAARK